jgi:ketosteroid isomerase-like protein
MPRREPRTRRTPLFARDVLPHPNSTATDQTLERRARLPRSPRTSALQNQSCGVVWRALTGGFHQLGFPGVALLAVAEPIPNSQASAEQYIRDSEAQWAEAVANGDVSVVQRILAEDFIGVDAADGSPYDKATAISWIETHHGECVSNHLDEMRVRFFGDTAVAQGSGSWEKKSGEPRRGRFAWTDTWVRRNGRWQIVAAEDLIAPPLPPKHTP